MENDNLKITAIPSEETKGRPRMLEIEFSARVTMYEQEKVEKRRNELFNFRTYKQRTPQWFKAIHMIPLEIIENGDPYEIGMKIKQIYQDFNSHLGNYGRHSK